MPDFGLLLLEFGGRRLGVSGQGFEYTPYDHWNFYGGDMAATSPGCYWPYTGGVCYGLVSSREECEMKCRSGIVCVNAWLGCVLVEWPGPKQSLAWL